MKFLPIQTPSPAGTAGKNSYPFGGAVCVRRHGHHLSCCSWKMVRKPWRWTGWANLGDKNDADEHADGSLVLMLAMSRLPAR
jgi:hypothetical protein